MRLQKIFILFVFLLRCGVVTTQSEVNFKEFEGHFKLLQLPIEGILELTSNDTLDSKVTNNIIIRNQVNKPHYVDRYGKVMLVNQYYGLYPEEPFNYTSDEKINGKWVEMNHYFKSKLIPIGSLNLNQNYKSLIVKVIGFETTYYDLWNFSKDGKVLSVVCLFWGLRDAGPDDEKVTFRVVDSKITKDGNILWHENDEGLETFRTYKLNDEGLFQVINEEQKGESDS